MPFDHAWLFEKIDGYLKKSPNKLPIILDVGCGNSMLHTFLEEEIRSGVIGIDRIFGKCPYSERDRRMDICIDFTKDNDFFVNSTDIIYWCSSIEHNSIEEMRQCVESSFKALKPGGLFLATFCYAKETYFFKASDATVLSKSDAEDVFGVKWQGTVNFDEVVSEYKENILGLHDRYKKRYGIEEYAFVVGGAEMVKGK